MAHYYDHQPLVQLSTHVAVTGWLSELTRAVAYRTAAVLGLPFHDLDRLVEHKTGQQIGKLILIAGETSYRAAEAACLDRALRERPAGILALGDGALLDEENLQQVLQAAKLVVLDLDLPSLFWRVQTTCRRQRRADWHPLFAGVPIGVDELRPFFQTRRSAFERAAIRLDIRGLSAARASRDLQQWIESHVAPAERP